MQVCRLHHRVSFFHFRESRYGELSVYEGIIAWVEWAGIAADIGVRRHLLSSSYVSNSLIKLGEGL